VLFLLPLLIMLMFLLLLLLLLLLLFYIFLPSSLLSPCFLVLRVRECVSGW
jgi:hypothetical protein